MLSNKHIGRVRYMRQKKNQNITIKKINALSSIDLKLCHFL